MKSFIAVLLLCAVSGNMVQLNETVDAASGRQKKESMQRNIERLEKVQSDILARTRNVETLFAEMSLNITRDISQIKEEFFRIQTICSPPCKNGGQCVKNVCNCTSLFTGDGCQQAVCIPPCENGGLCMKNNFCNCTASFTGDRCLQDGPKCGIDFDNDNNNGEVNTSSTHVWPWMAAVFKNSSYTSHTEFVCGGSVIHPYFVLTSARCPSWYKTRGLSVKLGLSDLKKGTYLQEYQVLTVHTHPEFVNNSGYDIALLEVEEPIPFDNFVSPVCLPPREIPQNETVVYQPQSTAKLVVLRDYIEANSSSQNASLIVLNLTILPQEECRRKLKEFRFEKDFPSPDLSFCSERSTRRCPYWGSPVMQYRVAGDGTRIWTQVGINSVSNACTLLFSPRFDHLRAWIDATIAAASKQ